MVYNGYKALPCGRRFSPLLRGIFLPSGKGVYMVGYIELFTFCLVIIGIVGLAIKTIDILIKRK